MILQQYKIVFAGSMGAGKSTAIQTISNIDVLSTEAINTDTSAHQKTLTTVGIDYGEVYLDQNIQIGLYGTPGQQRFDFIWDVITQGAIGTIILIDHTTHDPLDDLAHYLNYFAQQQSNIIIAITHLDENSKLTTQIYHDWMQKQPQQYPLFFIDARIPDDILMLIDAMLANAEVQISSRV